MSGYAIPGLLTIVAIGGTVLACLLSIESHAVTRLVNRWGSAATWSEILWTVLNLGNHRYLPYHPTEFDEDEVRYFGYLTLAMGIIGQTALAGLCAWAWLRLGASSFALAVGLLVLLVLSTFLDRGFLHALTKSPRRMRNIILTWYVISSGAALALFFVPTFLITIQISAFLFWIVFLPITIWMVYYMLGTMVTLFFEPSSIIWKEHFQKAAWIGIGLTLVGFPMLFGWVAASVTTMWVADDANTVRAWLDSNPAAHVRECSDWESNGKAIRVGVTLSGGGYRAALTHAGVLSALDEQCVPIHLLSTVSGGSIVGTAYALGVPPQEFAALLAQQKPGLPNSLLSIFNSFKGFSQIYEQFFETAFFGNRTLADLPKRPTLLLNTTNLFPKTVEQARRVVDVGPTYLSRAVAASAAYPGVFGPIYIPLRVPGSDRFEETASTLVDGGVVENLGTEGIRAHLTEHSDAEWAKVRPDMLIVSDVSGYAGGGERMIINPPVDKTMFQANEIQFDVLHRFLYSEITGKRNVLSEIGQRPAWQQYYTIDYPRSFAPSPTEPIRQNASTAIETNSERNRLTTIVIPATSTAMRTLLDRYPGCLGPGGRSPSEIQSRVAAFSTLNELDRSDVEDAFWLGRLLGKIYGQAIECARRERLDQRCEKAPDMRICGP